MDISLNAEVKCTDGTNGRSVCIIINPVQNAVTHVVIETKGLLGMKYMVPVERISSSTPHQIQLDCTRQELAEMEPFIRTKFVGAEDSDYYFDESATFELEGDESFLWPYTTYEENGMYLSVEQIPHEELGFHRGAHVEATDGRIGHVDEFIINPENNHITHLVLGKGHLWGKKEIAIPISEIDRLEDDVVYLKLQKKQVQEMPSVPIQRRWLSG